MKPEEQLEAIKEYLGIEFEDVETFKTNHGKKFLTEKQVHSDKSLLDRFTGKTLKTITQKIISAAKELEIPIGEGEFNESYLQDIVPELLKRQKETLGKNHETTVTELKGQIGKSGEEAIKPYQEKLSKYEKALEEEKKAKQSIQGEYDNYKKTAADQIKGTRISYLEKDVMARVSAKFDPIAWKDELKRKGFESHLKENFKYDFDEHDKPVMFTKDGSKVKNPKKADEWLEPDDIVIMEADKFGLIPKNNQGGNQAFKKVENTGSTTDVNTASKPVFGERRIAPWLESGK